MKTSKDIPNEKIDPKPIEGGFPKQNPHQSADTPTRSADASRPGRNEDPAEGADFSKEENATRLDHEEGDSAGMPPRKTRKGETLH